MIGFQSLAHLLTFPIYSGYIAGTNHLRTGEPIRLKHLFQGYLYYFPILLIGILQFLAFAFGLLLLIIPGIYFLVAFSFACPIYLEYRQEGLGI
jgi:hypothetical protein